MKDLDVEGVTLRAGTEADAVCGVPPDRVARPENTEALGRLLAAARDAGATVTPRGGGTALDWGSPPRSLDLMVDTSALSWIDHNAGDLVVEVGAGTPLAELRRTLAEAGQRLSHDPVRVGGTVGGALATGVNGPRRLLAGTLRDLVIGMTLVRADGVVARSGGRVVKNVAGYDLAKLHTGGYGTLGVIASAAFRLHPLPPAVRVVSVPLRSRERTERSLAALRATAVVPAAVELDHDRLCVVLEGTAEGLVPRVEETVRALGGDDAKVTEALPQGWGVLPTEGTLARILVPPAEVPSLVEELDALAGDVRWYGSIPAGTLYLSFAPGTPVDVVEKLSAAVRRAPGRSAVLLRAEPHLHEAGVDPWGEVPGLSLMRAVKDSFDPDHRLSPGRFAGGI